MMNSNIYKRLLFTLFVVILFHPGSFAQEADSLRYGKKGLFFGLDCGFGQSQILNEGTGSVSGLASGTKVGVTGYAEVGYSFSNNFGISTGISLGSLNGEVTLDSYQNKFNTVDSENEAYVRQVFGTNIVESQNIGLLGIPVYLNFRIPLSGRMGFSLRPGISINFPFAGSYQSSGTFTYKGYYPKYNVLLENLPAYGFPTNAAIFTDGKLQLKPLIFAATISAGFDYFIRKNWQAAIALYYSKSLSDILAYDSPEKFQLSTDVDHINSMMGGSSKAILQSLGLAITLRYFLPGR